MIGDQTLRLCVMKGVVEGYHIVNRSVRAFAGDGVTIGSIAKALRTECGCTKYSGLLTPGVHVRVPNRKVYLSASGDQVLPCAPSDNDLSSS